MPGTRQPAETLAGFSWPGRDLFNKPPMKQRGRIRKEKNVGFVVVALASSRLPTHQTLALPLLLRHQIDAPCISISDPRAFKKWRR